MPNQTHEARASRLAASRIPPPGSEGEADVREVLARLLETRAVRFSDLQLARDLETLDPALGESAGHALFVAALAVSLAGGDSFMRLDGACAALERATWAPWDDDAANARWAAMARDAWRGFVAGREASFVRDPVVASFGPGTAAFQRQWRDADAVARRLRALREAGLREEDRVDAASVRDALRFAFPLDKRQAEAVEYAATHRFAVVTGGPGTGKTTIVCAILRALVSSGAVDPGRIALCAPTGRAAQRMGEALRAQCDAAAGLDGAVGAALRGLSGSTVHSLLGGVAPRFLHCAANPLPHSLVVVDESSMVGIPLMRALLEALPEDCRLVLIGDPGQLPPVDVGAVLGDIVEEDDGPGSGCVVRLVRTHRFGGRLKRAAEAAAAGDSGALVEAAELLPGDGWARRASAEEGFFVRWLPPLAHDAAREAHAAAVAWAESFGLVSDDGALVRAAMDFVAPEPGENGTFPMDRRAAALFDALGRSRILCVVREGPFGTEAINAKLFARRAGQDGGRGAAAPGSLPGVPVVVSRNTPDRRLYNGDVGVVVMAADGTPTAVFPRGDSVVSCPVALLPEHELAYAVTVHKSQGSEYGRVLVVLPASENCPLLTRRLLYTAVTRARAAAAVLATPKALLACTAGPES